MRISRFRVRTLMIAVALCGVALGVRQSKRDAALAGQYRLRAEAHTANELNSRLSLRILKNPPATPPRIRRQVGQESREWMSRRSRDPDSLDLLVEWDPPPLDLDVPLRSVPPQPARQDLAALLTRQIAYEAAMRRKQERAARFPWLPVPPDPAPPR